MTLFLFLGRETRPDQTRPHQTTPDKTLQANSFFFGLQGATDIPGGRACSVFEQTSQVTQAPQTPHMPQTHAASAVTGSERFLQECEKGRQLQGTASSGL